MANNDRGHSDQVVSLDGDVVLVKWLDTRTVTLASNFVAIGNEDIVKRWNKNTPDMLK